MNFKKKEKENYDSLHGPNTCGGLLWTRFLKGKYVWNTVLQEHFSGYKSWNQREKMAYNPGKELEHNLRKLGGT